MAAVAIAVAVSVAVQLLTGLLSPKQTQTIEGSRTSDLELPKASLGAAIPIPFGVYRYNGMPIFWSPRIKETRSVRRRRVGGKGGGSTRREINYTYSANFAALACESPTGEGILSVNRIWLNGELYYNNGQDVTGQNRTQSSTSEDTRELRLSQHLEIYLGTDTQNPSPTIESFEGVGNVPAFRRKVYVVFRDLPLANFGNRLPKVDVEVIERENLKVSQVVKYLCESVGLIENQDFSTSGLEVDIKGFSFERSGSTVRSSIEELQQTFMFLGRDKGSMIEFFPFDRSVSPLSVTSYQLGRAGQGSQIYKRINSADTEIPRKVQIKAKNILSNHDPILKTATRASKTHDNTLSLDTKIVTEPQVIADATTKLLEYLWLKKEKYSDIVLPAFNVGAVNAGDLLTILLENRSVEIFIQAMKTGANYELEIEGCSWNGDIESFVAPTQNQEYDDSWELPDTSEPVPIVLDIPLVSDADADHGLYVGLNVPDGWVTGALYGKLGANDYEDITDVNIGAISGTVATAIPVRSPLIIDEFTMIDVVVDGDALNALSSCTEDQFLAQKNLALIGNELVAFQNATAINATTYRLSRLLRGCRGTESAIATHTSNENFYLVKDAGFIQHEGLPSYLGQTATYAGVPDGGSILNTQIETSIIITGEAARPYAPVNPRLTLNTSTNELTLEWDRRTRRDGDWRDNVEVPLEEAGEQYEVILFNNVTSYFMSSPSITFPYVGVNAVTAVVYQLSSAVGRGKPLNIIDLPVSRII